ncbi:MAG: hypothetical protein J5701_00390 [Bacteroidales bacterium]|nr:hypothetical protein [Bacteroidales bacterium]
MKKFFLAAVAALVVVGLVFVACKKENSTIEEQVTPQRMHKLMAPDTIYIGGNYERNLDCDESGAGCAFQSGTIVVRPSNMNQVRNIFHDLILAEGTSNGEETKRGIIIDEISLFGEFIPSGWLDKIVDGTGSISCEETSTDKFIFDIHLMNNDGGTTYFQYADNSVLDFVAIPVWLAEEGGALN